MKKKKINKEEEITAGATLIDNGTINNDLINKFLEGN